MLKLIFLLRGVASGFVSPKLFTSFFDWFYPTYFKIIARVFNCFSDDLYVLSALFKFLRELLDNQTNRLKFDSSSTTGFYLFKEISNLMSEFL